MAITDEQVLEQHKDAAMIERPHLWPYQFLPVKRAADTGIETGVVSPARYEEKIRIYKANLVRISRENKDKGPVTIRDVLAPYEFEEFTDGDGAVDAGWRVD
jgi:hypothetical protein